MKTLMLALILLAGCATPEERAAAQERYLAQLAALCDGYGFARGTEGHARCMMDTDRQRREIDSQNSAAMLDYSARILTKPVPQPRPAQWPQYQR